MRVLKFGGKSLSSVEKTQKICKYIKKIYKNDKKLIIVVSAIGSTTDTLTSIANTYGDTNLCPNELAKLLSTGETQSSALFSIMLNSMGVPSKSFSAYDLKISTFGDPLNSKIAYINKSKILNELNKNTVAVVAGFQGINKQNEITLLGRGGSDTTAAALAAIFNTTAEIYSDYDGIFAGDPRLFEFKKIKAASHSIMIQMAKAGAKVLDPRAVKIAKDFNINILSKSSIKPEGKGSLISNIESDVVSISTIDHLSQITINFSNEEKIKFLVKNVIYSLNGIKFYNLSLKQNKITFLIETQNKLKVVGEISKKLNLLKTSK